MHFIRERGAFNQKLGNIDVVGKRLADGEGARRRDRSRPSMHPARVFLEGLLFAGRESGESKLFAYRYFEDRKRALINQVGESSR